MDRNRINALYSIIEDANAELATLKEKCEHKDGYFISLYGDYRSSYPQRLCNTCDSPMGTPTEEEYKQFEQESEAKTIGSLEENGFTEEEISELTNKK